MAIELFDIRSPLFSFETLEKWWSGLTTAYVTDAATVDQVSDRTRKLLRKRLERSLRGDLEIRRGWFWTN